MKRHLLGIINTFDYSNGNVAADLNSDGFINSTDLSLIKRHILKIIDKFPAEKPIVPTPTHTPTHTPTPASTSVKAKLDQFGIRQLNPTMENSREWFSKFHEGTQRSFTW